MYHTFIFTEIEPRVGLITLNRPEKLNAINPCRWKAERVLLEYDIIDKALLSAYGSIGGWL